LANLLNKFGVEPVVAEWYLTPGEPLDKKVFDQIDKSDCVVALLTGVFVIIPKLRKQPEAYKF